MSKQIIIDTIKKEFKGKAVNEYGHCVYLADDGKKCAFGMFIPDGHKAQYSESNSNALFNEYPDLLEILPTANKEFWRIFQRAHDTLDDSLSIKEQRSELINWVNENYDKYDHGEKK